uniref:DUF676 domain-containing protein n=1 Tax=Heterorhabditis bacteriophora TaxID=37862 RepID=A0A1I7WP36_HETBA
MNAISLRLEDSERPWATLEAETVHLSSRLSIMFSQLLHLTLHSEGIKTAMDNEYYEWRLRMLGEAFFFSEKPISSLLSPQTVYTEVGLLHTLNPDFALLSVVAKAKYLQKLPRFPIHCPATDPTADNCCIVFEERFLAGNTDAHNSGLRNSTHDTIDCIRNDAGDCFARKDSRKTIRLPRLRHRSVENKSLSPLHHMRPRMGSATAPSCELVINIENSSDSVDETVDSPSSSKRVTAVLSFEDFPPDKVSMIVDFVKERENVKTKLKMQSFDGYLYSELASHPIRPALLTSMGPMKYNKLSHLVVFVHGLEGTSDDLTPYRNALRIAAPDAGLHFLLSEANQCKTWADFDTMADNLLDEVHNYMMASLEPSVKVSFVAHSLGGIIVRAALAKANADWLHPRLHTLLTINSPHLGLTYLGRGVNWGLQLIQWWKQSRSMEQLSLRDEISFHDSFLFQLSEKKTFSHFKYVLLIGTPPDVFVPCHSSLLAPCKTANKDFSALGTTYREMLSNILNEIVSSERGTTVVRFTTMHSIPSAKSSRLTGRAVSALKYFI